MLPLLTHAYLPGPPELGHKVGFASECRCKKLLVYYRPRWATVAAVAVLQAVAELSVVAGQ